MTETKKLLYAERNHAHTVEIREKSTGKTGVAMTTPNGIRLNYGADDGSDDKTVTPENFNRDFIITAVLYGRNERTE